MAGQDIEVLPEQQPVTASQVAPGKIATAITEESRTAV